MNVSEFRTPSTDEISAWPLALPLRTSVRLEKVIPTPGFCPTVPETVACAAVALTNTLVSTGAQFAPLHRRTAADAGGAKTPIARTVAARIDFFMIDVPHEELRLKISPRP